MTGFEQSLCVSIHDAAPATWDKCRILAQAIREVAPIPLTLLAVPAWHHRCHDANEDDFCGWLGEQRAAGSELALHGYTHLDEGRGPNCPWTFFCRQIYTQGEGEFAGLSAAQARQRLQWGLEWFARRGWSPQGFVAPAWLLSAGSWEALRDFRFLYTTTFSHFHLLEDKRRVFAPSLVYSARSGWGSFASRLGTSCSALALREAPLIRLALHPADVHHRATVLHCQRMVEKLLRKREALTKAQFATRLLAATRESLPQTPAPRDRMA